MKRRHFELKYFYVRCTSVYKPGSSYKRFEIIQIVTELGKL